MAARTLPAGTYLSCAETGDGEAIVVAEGTDEVDGLIALVQAVYGGEKWSRENPVLVEAAKDVKIETWRSCTKAWREAELGGMDDSFPDWWAPHGDGRREVLVAFYPGYVDDLGDEAANWERLDGDDDRG